VMSWCGDLPVQRQFGCCVGSTLTDRLTTSTPAILVQTDAPWRVVACNQKWEQLCGYSAQEACGQPPSLLHGPCTDKALTEGHRTACVTEGAARMLIVNYTKGGRPFAHRVHSQLVEDGSGVRYFLTESSEECGEAARAALKAAKAPDSSSPLLLAVFALALALVLLAPRCLGVAPVDEAVAIDQLTFSPHLLTA